MAKKFNYLTSESKITLNILIGCLILFAIVGILYPDVRTGVYLYALLSLVSVVIFIVPDYQDEIEDGNGVSKNNIGTSVIVALVVGSIFYFGSRFLPGFSLGYPTFPNAISDGLKAFLVLFCAPVIESIFCQGAIFAYIRNWSPSKKWIYAAIVLQAFVFASIHLTAYIIGFYSMPNWATALGAFWAQVGVFTAAFLFALIAGWIVSLNGVKNLLFVIIFHLIVNVFIFTSLTIVNLYILPLMSSII